MQWPRRRGVPHHQEKEVHHVTQAPSQQTIPSPERKAIIECTHLTEPPTRESGAYLSQNQEKKVNFMLRFPTTSILNQNPPTINSSGDYLSPKLIKKVNFMPQILTTPTMSLESSPESRTRKTKNRSSNVRDSQTI